MIFFHGFPIGTFKKKLCCLLDYSVLGSSESAKNKYIKVSSNYKDGKYVVGEMALWTTALTGLAED